MSVLALNELLADAFNDPKRFVDYVMERNREKLTSPLYRALFWVLSAKTLIDNAGSRWQRIHKGVTLNAQLVGNFSAEGVFKYPPYLANSMTGEIWTRVTGLALELAGAKELEICAMDWTPTQTSFKLTWVK